MNSGKKVGVIVSVGIAAAAAGIVVVAAIVQWRIRQNDERNLATNLRDVQDVLSDCYSKIRAIESHLPGLVKHSEPQSRTASISMSQNGNPISDL